MTDHTILTLGVVGRWLLIALCTIILGLVSYWVNQFDQWRESMTVQNAYATTQIATLNNFDSPHEWNMQNGLGVSPEAQRNRQMCLSGPGLTDQAAVGALADPLTTRQFQHLLLVQRRQRRKVVGVQALLDRERRLFDTCSQRIGLPRRHFQFGQAEQILQKRLLRLGRFPAPVEHRQPARLPRIEARLRALQRPLGREHALLGSGERTFTDLVSAGSRYAESLEEIDPEGEPKILDVRADPDNLVVSYRVRFENFGTGERPTVLELVLDDLELAFGPLLLVDDSRFAILKSGELLGVQQDRPAAKRRLPCFDAARHQTIGQPPPAQRCAGSASGMKRPLDATDEAAGSRLFDQLIAVEHQQALRGVGRWPPQVAVFYGRNNFTDGSDYARIYVTRHRRRQLGDRWRLRRWHGGVQRREFR